MKYVKPSIAALTIMFSSSALIAATDGKVDTNADGIVTKAEARAAAQMRFEKMDLNGDAALNISDRDTRAKARFAKIDGNGDGVLSEEEFLAVRQARLIKSEERNSKRKNRTAKRHGKKPQDKKRHGKKQQNRTDRVSKLLKHADNNADQSISREEFIAFSDVRFARVDTNNDGQITKDERRVAREERRAARQAQRAARKEERAQRR